MQFFNRVGEGFIVNETGPFYLGDPCYCFGNSTTTWSEFCDYWFRGKGKIFDNGITFNKDQTIEILGLSTAYGDGYYPGDVFGTTFGFPVDAGLLGLVPMQYVEYGSSYQQDNSLGMIVKLERGDYVEMNDGLFTIIRNTKPVVSIETKGDDDEFTEDFDDNE